MHDQQIVQQEEQQVVQEMKVAHKRYRGSLADIGQQLKAWQASLGKGRFKHAYMAAGWTKTEIYSCYEALQNQQHPSGISVLQPIENIEEPQETNELHVEEDSALVPAPRAVCSGEVCDPSMNVRIVNFGANLIDVGDLGGVCQYFLLKIKKTTIERVLSEVLKDSDEPDDLKEMWQFIVTNLFKEKTI